MRTLEKNFLPCRKGILCFTCAKLGGDTVFFRRISGIHCGCASALYNKGMRGRKEQPGQPEIQPELVQSLKMTFFNRFDCYPLQQASGKYWRIKQPLTDVHIAAHLRGTLTLGVYALDAGSSARWLCLDADTETHWTHLCQLAADLHSDGMQAYLETSLRGGHCWLFTPQLPGQTIRQFGKALLHRYQLEIPELYPKQAALKTGVGSLVRLPFGIHRKSGKRYGFITPAGEALAPTLREQIMQLRQPQQVSQRSIDQLIATLPAPPPSPSPKQIFAARSVSGERLSERLKSASSVYDFVSRYVQLDAHGKGLCPFHDDQIESFQVNRAENYWHCYAGCGGGSIIDFFMRWRAAHGQDGSFTASVKTLAELLL